MHLFKEVLEHSVLQICIESCCVQNMALILKQNTYYLLKQNAKFFGDFCQYSNQKKTGMNFLSNCIFIKTVVIVTLSSKHHHHSFYYLKEMPYSTTTSISRKKGFLRAEICKNLMNCFFFDRSQRKSRYHKSSIYSKRVWHSRKNAKGTTATLPRFLNCRR